MISALIWIRSGNEILGGHRLQAEKTAECLRTIGVDVTVSTGTDPPLDGFTLVHGFGLSPSDVRRCRERGLAVCLSTIYCSRRYTHGLDQRMGEGAQFGRRLRLALALGNSGIRLRHVDKLELMSSRSTTQRLAFESADILLPNSKLEASAIQQELGVTTPMVIVPNGVDDGLFAEPSYSAVRREDVVMYVGRFEPHKNQLGLIRALRRSPYKLVLVGPTHPHHQDYAERCRREARADVEFIDGVTQQELVPLYGSARVHALPSWYETTGLVSLEAAALGCQIVSTERGYAREYFDSFAWYCDPADPQSIAEAVDLAMGADYDPSLRERVLERFTWRCAAVATLQAYERALAGRTVRKATNI